MNLYELYPTKQLKKLKEDKTYVTENLINSLHINMPSTFGDYPIKELELELRCYLPTVNDGVTEYSEYMGYQIDVTQKVAEIPITNDITGAVQIVKVMIIATKDGNVIGKTNFVDKQIYDAPLKGEPLTPREEFDKVISEQRAEIAEQAETITTQGETITQQSSQITELNGEVTELQGEVAEQQATITRQNTTIDELNTRRIPVYIEPQLVPKEITPSLSSQYEEPPEGKDGFSAITVNPITADLIPNLEPQNVAKNKTILGVTGTFDSFPENPVGGMYFYEPNENDKPTKLKCYNTPISDIFALSSVPYLSSLVEVDLSGTVLTQLPNEFCYGMLNIETVIFPRSLRQLSNYAFYYCSNLKKLEIPNGVMNLNSTFCIAQCLSLEELFLPNTIASVYLYLLQGCSALKQVVLENGFNCNNLKLNMSTLYSHDTILSWFNALADRTGLTAFTLTIGATNIAKMTAEEIAIATNKNWNIA